MNARAGRIERLPGISLLLLFSIPLLAAPSCGVRDEPGLPESSIRLPAEGLPEFKTDPHETAPQGNQIDGVVRRVLQDRRGDFWFGGQMAAARYDGHSLVYYDLRDEYGAGVTVHDIAEDRDGNLWFATTGGLTRFDGRIFTTFTAEDGLPGNDVWRLFVDSRGDLWITTMDGVCRYDGKAFSPFPIPPSTRWNPDRGVTSPVMVWGIAEDRRGTLWFAAEGSVYTYDGTTLSRIPVLERESTTYVNSILEDSDGVLWFATQKGLIRFDGNAFTNVTRAAGLDVEAGSLAEDGRGDLWLPVLNAGVYRYDGTSFTLYSTEDGLGSLGIHHLAEDDAGRLWACGWMGVYRYDGDRFVNVTRDGPW